MRRHLEGAEYPATTVDLILTIQANGAPAKVTHRLGQLPDYDRFSSPQEVVERLENVEEESDKQTTPPQEVA